MCTRCWQRRGPAQSRSLHDGEMFPGMVAFGVRDEIFFQPRSVSDLSDGRTGRCLDVSGSAGRVCGHREGVHDDPGS